jgi:replicative DNA helicase
MLSYNFSHLMTESLRASDPVYLKRVKPDLLTNIERAGLELLLGQVDLYGRLPTIDVVKKHPQAGLLIAEDHKGEPLHVVGENALDQILIRWVRQQVRQYDSTVNPRTRIDLSGLQKIVDIARTAMPDEVEVTLMNTDIDSLMAQTDISKSLHFGYNGIDRAAGGLMPGEVGVMTARTGNGKSLFCCHAAVKWIREGKRVLFVSCEMPPPQLLHRIYGILGSFNPKLFRLEEGKTEIPKHMTAVHDELNVIRENGGNILFLTGKTNLESIKNEVLKRKPDVLIVDGIYLLTTGTMGSGAQDWQRVKAVSNDIKADIALGYNMPVLTTTQLKRGANEDLYTLEDIAYSDAIGQDGDIILAASRDPGLSHTLNVQVIKNRNGETFGGSRLTFDWDTMTLEEAPLLRPTLTLGKGDEEDK